MAISFDVISDLHFNNFSTHLYPNIKPNSEILVMLGDVCEVDQVRQMMPFFRYVSSNWKLILFIPGNHEFYGYFLDDTVSVLKCELQSLTNIKILDNECYRVNNTLFVGSTLWSNMDNDNPVTKVVCKGAISDYKYIKKSYYENNKHPITPNDTVALFDRNIEFIEDSVFNKGNDEIVILTHHAPSYSCVDAKYKGERTNGAFVSDLNEFILDNPQIKVWAYGHTHNAKDFYIDTCRVVSNPKGYSGENMNDKQYKPITVKI